MTFRYPALHSALLTGAALCALAVTHAARADEGPAGSTVSPVVVTAPSSISGLGDLPTTTESITADQIAKTINVITPE
ncbi:MAG: hypothetical protein JWR47_1630, partial [Phenylobacterium sp.]|nr:hypothetical protein [Phenylobacterium sp.]